MKERAVLGLRARRWRARCLVALPLAASGGAILWWSGLRGCPPEAVPWVFFGLIATIVAVRAADKIVMTKARGALDHATVARPAPEARRHYDEYARAAGPRWAQSIEARWTLSTLLLCERRWAAAREVLLTIPCDQLLKADYRSALRSNLAKATLECGAPDAALPIALDAVSSAPTGLPAHELAIAKTVLGSCYLAAGKYDEAIVALEFGLAHGRPHNRAACAFHLGEVFAALGRTDEARAMFSRACETAPNGRSAQRASERLADLRAYR
jgi:tetratricopeptide (TPR) repeat protein